MHAGTTGRAADLLLVVGTLTLVVSMSAVLAGLLPGPIGRGEVMLQQRPLDGALVGTLLPAPSTERDDPIRPPDSPREWTDVPAAIVRVGASAPGSWASPLYPQNGVTLWDRIRVSSQRDRRAFLLGTAVQLHAPQIAATPGPSEDSLRSASTPSPTIRIHTRAVPSFASSPGPTRNPERT